MTREQKGRLAMACMSQVGDLFEFWSEQAEHHGIEDIDPGEAMSLVAKWLSKLPGEGWDSRLGPPPPRS